MKFEVGKYFYLTHKMLDNPAGVYRIDDILPNHYKYSGQSLPATWIMSHNIETDKECGFAIGSAFESYCKPHLRQTNIDILLNEI
jgi:hypothetical protein